MALDLALALDADNKPILHRADCPVVRKQAAEGQPVMTMFDCQRAPPDDIARHDCLKAH